MKLRRSALRFLELLESRENPSFVPLPTTALANVSQFATIVLSSGQPTTIVVGENGTNAPTVSPTQLQVLQSTGTGFTVIQTIDASAPVGATFPYQVTDLAVGDFNVDGHEDVIVTERDFQSPANGQTLLFLSNSAGVLQPKIVLDNRPAGAIAVGDFDPTGSPNSPPDFVLFVNDNSGLSLLASFQGNGDGTFTPFTTQPSQSTLPFLEKLVAKDVDHDGNVDFAYVDSPGDLVIQYGNGDGTFTLPVSSPNLGFINDFDFADFDLTNGEDVVVADSGGVAIHANLGGRVFNTTPVTVPAGGASFPSFVATGDFDNNGLADVVMVDSSGSIFDSLNQGGLVFSADSANPYLPAGSSFAPPRDLLTVDFDGDTNLDIVSLNSTSTQFASPFLNLAPRPTNTTISVAPFIPFGQTFNLIGDTLPSVPIPAIPQQPAGSITQILSGQIFFSIDGTPAGNGFIDVAGHLVVTFSGTLTPGPHTLDATYVDSSTAIGNPSPPSFRNSIAPTVNFTVGAAPVTTAVTNAVPDPSTYGTPVDFTVTLTRPPGIVINMSGTVDLFDGSTLIGSAPVPFGRFFTGTMTITGLPVGSGARSITAVYSGDATYQGSTSAPLNIQVNQATTTTTIFGDPLPGVVNHPVTLTAFLTTNSPTFASLTGTVTFSFDGQFLGTAAVDPLTNTAEFTTTALPIGFIGIGAQYSGDANAAGSSDVDTYQVIDEPTFVAGTDNGAVVCIYNGTGELRHGLATFGSGFDAGVRAVTADFTGDGIADLAAGSGPGVGAQLIVFDDEHQAALFVTNPFEATFTGGVYTAAGDITGDGIPDIVVTAGFGGGPRVRIFDGSNFQQIADFFGIADVNFRGGARAAIGDVNGDGRGDLIIAAGEGGGPRIAVYDGASITPGVTNPTKLVADFFAFDPNLTQGVFLAAGDFNLDESGDIIVGAGTGGSPRVSVFSGASLMSGSINRLADFFAGDPNARGGVRVTARDMDLDGKIDVITGAGQDDGNEVRIYLAEDLLLDPNAAPVTSVQSFPGLLAGVYVG